MAKRLIKVAKEFNIGTSTVVDYLREKGFDIENKPIAKVDDAMMKVLSEKYASDAAVKKKANSIEIGTRPTSEPTPPPTARRPTPPPPSRPTPPPIGRPTAPPPRAVTPPPAAPAPVTPPPAPEPKVETPVAEPKAAEPVVARTEAPAAPEVKAPETPAAPESTGPEIKPAEQTSTRDENGIGLKIQGKIDLDSLKKPKPSGKGKGKGKPAPKKDAPKPEPKTEQPQASQQNGTAAPDAKGGAPAPAEADAAPTAAKPTPGQPEDQQPTGTPEAASPEAKSSTPGATDQPKKVPGIIRAAAPELRGLKIKGKIDLSNIADNRGRGRSDKKKEDENKDSSGRRPRTRITRTRTRTAGPGNRGGQRGPGGRNDRGGRGGARGGRGGRRDDNREVTQKEIDDKIRATMARLQGGGKRKRQRMRRENRERLRERQDLRDAEGVNEKLEVTEFVTAQELANLMDVPVTDVITACFNLGVIVSINQRLDAEIIELVAGEFDQEVEFINAEDLVDIEEEEIVDDPEDLEPRAPIVTVMGHVDHGKTSLLDFIRKAAVADGEAGGITQHIGAYEVQMTDDSRITFLDTPGHEAFTAMRARGAKVTDVAIIIIAADDSIMPQTKEAISHAQAAGVPIVFAINKIDKPGASPERIKQELSGMNLLVEEWGGEYQSQDISAKTGQGIDELLEKVLLQAELLELSANPDRKSVGTILEASLDKGRGYVAKTLVQTGTLEIGDAIVAGAYSGKVKAMFNERGQRVKIAGPSQPVAVLGLNGAPQAGERFREMDTEVEAREIASKRAQLAREQANRATKRISLDEIGRRLALGTFKELNLIVKGDFDGSVEALSDSLIKQSIETVQVNVIHKAVGQIIESDVLLASASDAIIVGFQVRPSLGARRLAEREGVEIKTYSIIYEAIDEIRSAIEGLLEPTKEEKVTATVTVRETFKISRIGTIAGCYVEDGKIERNHYIRVVRNGIVVYPTKEGVTGEISSLRRHKDDVKEVRAGFECGLTIKNFNDIKVDDQIEAYEIIEVKQTLASLAKASS